MANTKQLLKNMTKNAELVVKNSDELWDIAQLMSDKPKNSGSEGYFNHPIEMAIAIDFLNGYDEADYSGGMYYWEFEKEDRIFQFHIDRKKEIWGGNWYYIDEYNER